MQDREYKEMKRYMEQSEYDKIFRRIEDLTKEVENPDTRYDEAEAKRKEAMALIAKCREMLRKSGEELEKEQIL